jgi:hypothetical protein
VPRRVLREDVGSLVFGKRYCCHQDRSSADLDADVWCVGTTLRYRAAAGPHPDATTK